MYSNWYVFHPDPASSQTKKKFALYLAVYGISYVFVLLEYQAVLSK
jgi:hypothetical protein